MVEDISLFFLEMLNSRTGNRGVQSMTHTYIQATYKNCLRLSTI